MNIGKYTLGIIVHYTTFQGIYKMLVL